MIKNTSEPFPHLLSSDNVSTIIEAAITTGHISTDNLCLVMTYSGPRLYDDRLSWLLEEHDIEEPNLSSKEGQFKGWKALFDKWSRGIPDGIHIKRPDGIPLQEVEALFLGLKLKPPGLLFPAQGMTPWLFPELDYEKLSATALKLANKYPFLKRIRLYKNPDQTGSDGKYLLIFETHDPAEYAGTYEGNVFNSRFSEMTVADSDFEKALKEIYKEGHVPSSNLSTPWVSWIIRPNEPAFDPIYPEPFNTESGISEQSHHWVLFEPTKDGVMSEVNDIMAARSEGFIRIENLVMFFSDEVSFTHKHLPSLWGKFDCLEKRGPIGSLSNQRQRVKRWMTVLYRIAFGFVDIPTVAVSLTSLYGKLIKKHVRGGDGYLPADLDHFKAHGFDGCYLELADLREYLVNYAGLSEEDLPSPLFSSATTEPMSGIDPAIDKPKRRSACYAKKQEEVQAMALTIWDEKQRRLPESGKIKPEYRKLYSDKRMKEICIRSDNTPYPPKTIEKWANIAWKQFKKRDQTT